MSASTPNKPIFSRPIVAVLAFFAIAGVIRSCQMSAGQCQCAQMGHDR